MSISSIYSHTPDVDNLDYQQLMQPHQPLGLTGTPHLQFYRPLGAQYLSILDPSIFSTGEASAVQAFLEPFQDNNLFQQPVRPADQSHHTRSGDHLSNANSDSIQRQTEAPEDFLSRPPAEEVQAKEIQAKQPQSGTFLDGESSVEAVGDTVLDKRWEDSIAQTKPASPDADSSGEFPSHLQAQLESIPTLPIESTETTSDQFAKSDTSIDPVESELIEAPSSPIQRQSIETTEALPIPSQTTEAINVGPSIDSIEAPSSLIHSQSADKIEVKPASVRLPAIQAQLNETADQANVESSELSTDSTIDSLPTTDQLQSDESQLIQQPQTIHPQIDEPQAIQSQQHKSLTASPRLNESQTVRLQADSFELDHLPLDRLDSPIRLAIEPDVPTVETKVPEIQADATTNSIVDSYDSSINPAPQLLGNNLEPIEPDATSTTDATDVSTSSERSQMLESASPTPEIQTKLNSSTIQTSESKDRSVLPTEQPLNQPSTQQLDIQDRSLELSITESPERSRVNAIDLPIVTDSTPNIQAQSDASQSDSAGYNSSDELYATPNVVSSLPDRSLESQAIFPTPESFPETLAAEPITSIDPTQASEVQSQSIQPQAVPVLTSVPNIQADFDSAPVDSSEILDFAATLSSETNPDAFSTPSLEPQPQASQSPGPSLNPSPEALRAKSILANAPTQTPQIQLQEILAQTSQTEEIQSHNIPDPALPPNIQANFDSVNSAQLDATSPETSASTSGNPSLEIQSQSASSNSYPEAFVTESIDSNAPTQLPEIQSQQIQTQEHLSQNSLDSVMHSKAINALDSSEAHQSTEVISPSTIEPIQPSIEVSETPIAKTEQPTIQKSAVSTPEELEKTSPSEFVVAEPLKPVTAEPDASATATESIDSSVDPRAPIPQLPTVLQNLTVLQPLNSPTIAAKLQTSPQHTSESILPTDRRSTPHSQNEDAATAMPSNSHWQDTRSDPIANSFVPSSFSSESPAHSQPPASDWQESPYSDLYPYEIPQLTIQTKPANIQTEPQAESPESINHSTSDHEAASQSGNPQSSTQNPDNASQSADKLEQLAQAMYRLLRQRLAVERERSGNNYAGRLPW
jgi:hypothetical protein